MKKLVFTVVLSVLSGSVFAHNWFPEGIRITTYSGSAVANITPISVDRSFGDKAACEAFLTEQNTLSAFVDGNGRSMVSVVRGKCHNAPIVMWVIVPQPE